MINYWLISRMLRIVWTHCALPANIWALDTPNWHIKLSFRYSQSTEDASSITLPHNHMETAANLHHFWTSCEMEVLAQNTNSSFLPVLPEHAAPTVNIFQFPCSSHWRRPEVRLSWGNTSCVDVFEVRGLELRCQRIFCLRWWSFQPNNLHLPMVMEDSLWKNTKIKQE